MLDFDHMCKRKTPSVCAMVRLPKFVWICEFRLVAKLHHGTVKRSFLSAATTTSNSIGALRTCKALWNDSVSGHGCNLSCFCPGDLGTSLHHDQGGMPKTSWCDYAAALSLRRWVTECHSKTEQFHGFTISPWGLSILHPSGLCMRQQWMLG